MSVAECDGSETDDIGEQQASHTSLILVAGWRNEGIVKHLPGYSLTYI